VASAQTSPSAAGQNSAQTTAGGGSGNNPSTVSEYCKNLSQGKEEAAALEAVCEFALFLPRKLPNVICDEERIRYQEDELGNDVHKDKITAKVRYEDGQEQYTEVTINGKQAQSATLGSSVSWSEGEFAQDLLAVFAPQSSAQFKFTRKDKLNSAQVLIFEFKVKRKNNRLRFLQSPSGEKLFPGYQGRLWIDKSNSHLMRLERKVDDVDADFLIQRADLVIDYGDMDLADGTRFVLPEHAVNVSCPGHSATYCWHNQLAFKHWHKFAARARILTSEEEPPALTPEPPAETVPPAETSVPVLTSVPLLMDVSRGASIAEKMLNDQSAEIGRSLREAEIREAEIAAAVRAAAADARPQTAARAQVSSAPAAMAAAPTEMPEEQVPVFKSSARLVLVPTVVRDSRGQTVGNLQKADFRLLDERKPQIITQFSLERPGSILVRGESAGMPVQAPSATTLRHAAYVFDDIHSSLDDLIRARDAAKRHLTSLPPGDRAAIFTLSAKVMLDFTNDGAKLNDALQRIRPNPLTAAGACPEISYAQADLIQNQNDALALEAATAEAMKCSPGVAATAAPARRLAQATAAQVLVAGRAESQLSFKVLSEVVREISRMPGQRCVVLVSPGFPTAEMQQAAADIIDDALKAQVMVNVLDPSGLSTTDQIEYGTATQLSDVLVDLTSGTGGTFFHNRNNMDEGFQRTALPEIFYILGFAPQKLDGKLHKLKVTVQASDKLSVQARRGYYALKSKN